MNAQHPAERLLDLAAALGIDPAKLLAQFETLRGDPEADALADTEAAVVFRAVRDLVEACASADRVIKAAVVAKALGDLWTEAQRQAQEPPGNPMQRARDAIAAHERDTGERPSWTDRRAVAAIARAAKAPRDVARFLLQHPTCTIGMGASQ